MGFSAETYVENEYFETLKRAYPRFESLVKKSPITASACHPWLGAISKSKNGFSDPKFRVGRKVVFAHRYIFEYYNRTVLRPEDHVYRTCGTKHCVNPIHLRSSEGSGVRFKERSPTDPVDLEWAETDFIGFVIA